MSGKSVVQIRTRKFIRNALLKRRQFVSFSFIFSFISHYFLPNYFNNPPISLTYSIHTVLTTIGY